MYLHMHLQWKGPKGVNLIDIGPYHSRMSIEPSALLAPLAAIELLNGTGILGGLHPPWTPLRYAACSLRVGFRSSRARLGRPFPVRKAGAGGWVREGRIPSPEEGHSRAGGCMCAGCVERSRRA